MASRSNETLLTALGFTRPVGRLYERLLLQAGVPILDVAAAMDLAPEELHDRMTPLLAAEVVQVVGGLLQVRSPAEVVSAMIQAAASSAAISNARMQEIAGALPYLTVPTGAASGEAVDVGDPIDGEITAGADWVEEVRTAIRTTVGDLRWLRPDQWRMPWEEQMSRVVAEALASGRHLRAIYPVRVLADAPEIIQARTEAGEEIRLLPEVPTRMLVLGTSHVMLPEPLGFSASPRSTIRQTGIVELATLFFDQLWEVASPIDAEVVAAPNEVRYFLLLELAKGSQDEQIARRLGMSLRTVRRRIAEIMEELGAHSRFQAGVEAARRGWL